jgi:hypothetical protein
MFHLIVYLVHGWVMTVLPRNKLYGVVLGYICVTKSPQQLACMFVRVIYMYGTSMDVPLYRLPCTRLGYIRFPAKYVIRGCTRLYLCGQNTPPAGMHERTCHTYIRNEYGWST